MQRMARGNNRRKQSSELSKAIAGPRVDSVNVSYAKNLGTTRRNGKVCWEQVQPARLQIGRVLALANGKLEEGSTRSFVEPFGAFRLNPSHLTTRLAMDDSELALAYFSNIRSRSRTHSQNRLPPEVAQNENSVSHIGTFDPEYISSLALVPNRQYSSKFDFDTSSPFIALSHNAVVSVYSDNPNPVLGMLATQQEIEAIKDKYSAHEFYREYVTDAMVAMAEVARNQRTDAPPAKAHLRDSHVAKSRPKAARECYTSNAVLTVYEGDAKVEFNLKTHRHPENAALGMFYKGLGNVIGISASMLIRTVTVKPIGEFLDVLGAQDKHEHYLAAAKYLTEPETVIAQEISYSANYYTDSYMHKGDCDVKVITVCAGDYEERAAGAHSLRDLAMVMFEFGNGIPLQHNIANTDDYMNNLFCHRLSVPSEIAYASIGKAVHKAVNASQGPIKRGWNHVITGDKNLKSIEFNVRANQIERNSRHSENDAIALSLQNVSTCSREFGMLFYGSSNAELAQCIRTELAHIFCPVGRPIQNSFTPWAPVWDTKTEVDLQTGPNLMRFQAPAAFNDDALSVRSAMTCDLDLDEIINLAAKPSAFDNEVYM